MPLSSSRPLLITVQPGKWGGEWEGEYHVPLSSSGPLLITVQRPQLDAGRSEAATRQRPLLGL